MGQETVDDDGVITVSEPTQAITPFQQFQQSQPTVHETSSVAAASQAKAIVEARYLVAIGRPRDIDTVRTRLLKDCKRPRFAEAARYKRPVGGGKVAEGPSIRFAESVVRHMGNIDVGAVTIYDDASKRIVRVTATDLETNATYAKDVTVEKTVERRYLKEGRKGQKQKALASRTNSYGETVYIVEATEHDMLAKEGALVSKATRTVGLRLVPADILEEAMDQCVETMHKSDAQDPDAARKRIADGFDSIGVSPAQLREYLDHELSSCSPAELDNLRALYRSIKEGSATWSDVMRAKREAENGSDPQPAGDRSTTEQVKAAVAAKAQAAEIEAAAKAQG